MHGPTRLLLGAFAIVAPMGAMPSAAPLQEPIDSPASAEQDVETQIDEVLAEYDEAYQEFMKAYRAAGTDEERSATFEASFPDAAEFAARLWPIIEAHPADAATAPALSWIFRNHYAEQEKAAALLIEHHMESEEILVVCSAYTEPTPKAAETLALVIEQSPHAKVKGYATLCLGEHLMAVAEIAREAQDAGDDERAGMAERYGQAALVMWMDCDPDEVGERAEEVLESVVAVYGAEEHPYGNTLGASAEGILYELRHLQVGMVAPDIEGNDLDGVAFKLSDYRGKVVVLDFWGHW